MARRKMTAKRIGKGLITWTRFHLPREQEWPTWSVDHPDVHVDPLAGVECCLRASLGRMVDNPEQAAYIIERPTLDDLKTFQSSPACAEFLQNPPRPMDVDSALEHLSLDDADAASRFLILKHATEAVTAEIVGRVTFTTFLVPRKVENMFGMYKDTFNSAFETFIPRGSEFMIWNRDFMFWFSAVWFWVLAEDTWVEDKFGKLDATTEDGTDQGRTIFCHFFLWQGRLRGINTEHEEASAADPQARESWHQAIEKVMAPATEWNQERWDIQEVPRFYPPEPEFDPELTPC
ncbi:uncharacterized protein BJX67DRAFT_380965 [Aspergillus lucknowensis]|uniref:Uncharacterized protein n=1 Tax=Aspergillus lucknowensis TaxID=176173 RepID=A0ABR4LSV6_9EURO